LIEEKLLEKREKLQAKEKIVKQHEDAFKQKMQHSQSIAIENLPPNYN
jgi:hypothetical protein